MPIIATSQQKVTTRKTDFPKAQTQLKTQKMHFLTNMPSSMSGGKQEAPFHPPGSAVVTQDKHRVEDSVLSADPTRPRLVATQRTLPACDGEAASARPGKVQPGNLRGNTSLGNSTCTAIRTGSL